MGHPIAQLTVALEQSKTSGPICQGTRCTVGPDLGPLCRPQGPSYCPVRTEKLVHSSAYCRVWYPVPGETAV